MRILAVRAREDELRHDWHEFLQNVPIRHDEVTQDARAVRETPHPHFDPGPDGVKFMVSTVRAGFPDAHLNVERVVGEDSMTAFHWILTGTH